MFEFSNQVPVDDDAPGLRLVRTPATGKLTEICTSLDLVGCNTHFYCRRTIPCQVENCEACEAGNPWRWHGWVACYNPKIGRHAIFEFTAIPGVEFKAYRERVGTLRGCFFEASRLGGKPRGRILLTCKTIDLQSINLPDAPDLPASLCQIWRLPKPALYVAGLSKGHPRINVRPDDDEDPIRTATKESLQQALKRMNSRPPAKTPA